MAVLTRRDPATLSPLERFIAEQVTLGRDPQLAVSMFLGASTAGERRELMYAWNAVWARPNQRMPEGEWDTMFVRAGRGYGKTRVGAESTRHLVAAGKARAVTIIGPTAADARDVMIEGPDSGLLAVHPDSFRPIYEPSKRLVTWPNGAIGHVRSAEEPDSVRGLQSELVWGDEPASWKTGAAPWDNAMLGNRLGRPHSILTGTPRPLPWLRELEKQPGTRVLTGSTYENVGNLAPQFIALILGRYENTRLGAQELHAAYLEDVEGAIWRLATIEANRIPNTDREGRLRPWLASAPWAWLAAVLTRDMRLAAGLGVYEPVKHERRSWEVWVGVDPPGETAECGIVVGAAPRRARGGHDHCLILDDMTVEGPPEVWGPRVVEAIQKWNAQGAVVEANQGGDMVRSTVHAADPNVLVEKIRAVQSKQDRAEPVSVLDSKGWIHHVGVFAALESQMTTWVAGESKSPDRLDARVHLVSKLLSLKQFGVSKVHNPVTGR